MMEWKPMWNAPHEHNQKIVVKHRDGTKMIVSWVILSWDEEGWWLEEGSLFQDNDLIGWCPIPE